MTQDISITNSHESFDRLKNFLIQFKTEIDFSKWFSFGERLMGFNQWASLNDYEYATTHPLDKAHQDAVKLMQDKFKQIIKGE